MVLHSWWGLTTFFRSLCDRLAENGFVALAPDLYDGEVASTVPAARALRKRSTARRREPVYRFLARQIEFLVQHEAVAGSRIGVLGCSMGGHWALWLAQRAEYPISATVTYYAARGGDYSESRSDFLCHFAERDAWVPAAARARLRRCLERGGARSELHVYPGTGHWFAESDRDDAFVPEAAELAWSRTLRFLRAAL